MTNAQRLLLAAVFLLSAASCSREDLPTPENLQQPVPLSRPEIRAAVEDRIQKEQSVFRWEWASDHLLWSAAVQTDSILAIGYQPVGEKEVAKRMHLIDIRQPEWVAAREKIIRFVVDQTNKAFPGRNYAAADLMPFQDDPVLPAIDIRVFSPEIIVQLRQMPEVRYVEPLGYGTEEVGQRSDAGCGVSPAWSIPVQDYTTTAPSAKIPWNFNNMNIPQAWNTSTGAGITIALLDTGTSGSQSKLGSEFNSGLSQNRVIDRKGTYVSSWWSSTPDGPNDPCGHGTQMAGLLAAPRGNGGASVGVAYDAGLLAIRATGDVVINGSSEKRGVADALTLAGNRSDVRIISMSIGDVFWSDRVADGIYFAYGKGKMLFAAAGTSLSWTSWWGVIFPATMAETIAVTGVKEGLPLKRCNTCHDGSKVDFVAVMQRSNDNDRTSLSLALSGNQPSYVGGSSAATATTAGIAALVWSTNPSMTRGQVLQRLKDASQFYPSRDSNFGWGLIDAGKAVGGR